MARQGDVFPRRDLPGTSENWGRHVEDRIVLGERSEIQLSQKVDNGLLANEGQLATISNQLNVIYDQQLVLQQQQLDLSQQQIDLAAQQADLVGRVSHQRIADNSPASLGNFPLGESTISGTSFSFTLDRPRTVQISQFAMASTTSPPVRVGIALNGVRKFNTSESSTTYLGEYGAPQTGAVHFSGLFTLPAGNHSVAAAVLVSGSSSAVVTVYSVSTVVDVLQIST